METDELKLVKTRKTDRQTEAEDLKEVCRNDMRNWSVRVSRETFIF